MVDNMAKGICDSWIGILNENWSASMMVGLRMMIAMVGASGMCG
jgi:hypothetical protein